MEISPLMIYFISVIDSVKFMFFTFWILITIFLICWIIGSLTVLGVKANTENLENDDVKNFLQKYLFNKSLYKIVAAGFICFSITTFIPSSKTVGAMILLPALVNNENVQNITSNGMEFLKKMTEEWANERISVEINKKSKAK